MNIIITNQAIFSFRDNAKSNKEYRPAKPHFSG